jgi:hypothetical protein
MIGGKAKSQAKSGFNAERAETAEGFFLREKARKARAVHHRGHRVHRGNNEKNHRVFLRALRALRALCVENCSSFFAFADS